MVTVEISSDEESCLGGLNDPKKPAVVEAIKKQIQHSTKGGWIAPKDWIVFFHAPEAGTRRRLCRTPLDHLSRRPRDATFDLEP